MKKAVCVSTPKIPLIHSQYRRENRKTNNAINRHPYPYLLEKKKKRERDFLVSQARHKFLGKVVQYRDLHLNCKQLSDVSPKNNIHLWSFQTAPEFCFSRQQLVTNVLVVSRKPQGKKWMEICCPNPLQASHCPPSPHWDWYGSSGRVQFSWLHATAPMSIPAETGNTLYAEISWWEIYCHVGKFCSHCSVLHRGNYDNHWGITEGRNRKDLTDHDIHISWWFLNKLRNLGGVETEPIWSLHMFRYTFSGHVQRPTVIIY